MIVSGIGYDSHRFTRGQHLVLGGVKIAYRKSFLAHSDGDVFLHALIDALLGASGFDDIGSIFPDTDPRYKKISSLELLMEVFKLIQNKINEIVYIDSIIIAEEPKLNKYKNEMKKNIAQILDISQNRINIKAKTNEKMDDIGKSKGIAAHVIVTIDREFNN